MRLLVTGGSGYLGTHVRRFFDADDFSRRSHLDLLNPDEAAQAAHYDVVIQAHVPGEEFGVGKVARSFLAPLEWIRRRRQPAG